MSSKKTSLGKSKKGLRSYSHRPDASRDSTRPAPKMIHRTTRRSGRSRLAATASVKGRVIPQAVWEKFSDDQLLDTRICDLGLRIDKDGFLGPKIQRLYQELDNHGLQFRPHVWLSDEWFSPDGIPGIAIPFCLAHPRLRTLERQQMMEVEGGTSQWCMRILRHEAGHAVDTAWRLHRRQSYKKVFGNYNAPYPESYRPRPNSKRYVTHLEPWYAQSHPAEDFAETFAVWLTPRSPWRTQYCGWPALAKLEYVEKLMEGIGGTIPKVRSRTFVDSVSRMSHTLREHYEDRQSRYCTRQPDVFDHDLRRLFPRKAKSRSARYSAAAFLQRNLPELVRVVCQWTGEYRYSVHQVMRQMIDRCRELELQITDDEQEVFQRTSVLLTVHTMNYLHGGFPRVAL
jgi:hypothetical protein